MIYTLLDIVLGIFYSLILFTGILYYINRKYENSVKQKRIILTATVLKIGAIFLYAAVYKLYYGYGDTLGYHWRGNELLEYILSKPTEALDILWTSGDDLVNKYGDFVKGVNDIPEYYNTANFIVVKFSCLFSIFGLNQYLPMAVFFTAIALVGSIKVAEGFAELFPRYRVEIFIAFLLIPSVLFWSTGINKDSLSIGFTNFLMFALIRILMQNRFKLKYLILALISFYFSLKLKSYIPIILIPSFMIYVISVKWNKGRFAKMRVLKFFTAIGLIVIGVPIMYYAAKYMIDDLIAVQIENIIRINVGQSGAAVAGDSSFDLGITVKDLDNSARILGFIPISIIITLFRPWIWEVKNPLMLISSLESFFFLCFTLLIFLRGRIIMVLPYIFRHKELLFFLVFTLVLCIPIGISSGNFGTIVRYKIPILPYFLIFLFMLNGMFRERRELFNSNNELPNKD